MCRELHRLSQGSPRRTGYQLLLPKEGTRDQGFPQQHSSWAWGTQASADYTEHPDTGSPSSARSQSPTRGRQVQELTKDPRPPPNRSAPLQGRFKDKLLTAPPPRGAEAAGFSTAALDSSYPQDFPGEGPAPSCRAHSDHQGAGPQLRVRVLRASGSACNQRAAPALSSGGCSRDGKRPRACPSMSLET